LEWDEIKKEILGEENILQLKTIRRDGVEEESEEEENMEEIRDLTEDEIKSLRRTLYLAIMSCVDYEECIHKILKLNIGAGHVD
jgi:pre-mRNA-splicing factor CWC22